MARSYLIQQYALRNISRSLFHTRHTLRKFTPPTVIIHHGHSYKLPCVYFFTYADCFLSLSNSKRAVILYILLAPPILPVERKSVMGTNVKLNGEQVVIIHSIRALFPVLILLEPYFKIHWLSD